MWSIGSASAALARQLRWPPIEEIANDEGMSRNHPDVGMFYDATWEPADAEVGQIGGLRSPILLDELQHEIRRPQAVGRTVIGQREEWRGRRFPQRDEVRDLPPNWLIAQQRLRTIASTCCAD